MYETYFQKYKIFIYYLVPNDNYTITDSTELQQFYFQSSHQINPKFIRKIAIASLQENEIVSGHHDAVKQSLGNYLCIYDFKFFLNII